MLDLRDNLTPGLENAKTNITSFEDRLTGLGNKITGLGTSLTTLAAPAAAAFGYAVVQAASFDEAVTNTGAILGYNREQIELLKTELLNIGKGTRAGPEGIANAFYDIVGGVADASTHMAILESAVATAEAGNADLGATTKALISIMNSYGFGADKASYASDVLTQTVGMGVGTMNDFAGAMPQVAGLAASLGIDFEDLGGMMAYLTTKGNTASESATQLAAMMTALLNPNASMKEGLNELGFSTGQAAIEQLGLVGAFEALSGTQTATTDGLAKMSGSVEALRGSTAFAGADVQGFFQTFRTEATGATEAARNIQMGSAAAQFDLLKSSISGVGIEIGTALLPSLLQLVTAVQPVISAISGWVSKNPEAVTTMAAIVAGALVLGSTLMVLGTTISSVGTIVGALNGGWRIFSALMPVTSGAISGLGTGITGFMGTLGGLLGKLSAVGAAVWAVIRAFQELQTFIATVNAGQQAVGNVHGGAIQSGAISLEQYKKAAYDATIAQFGPVVGEIMWGNPAIQAMIMQPYLANAPSKDTGGRGTAGMPYAIGTGAQPELFIPDSNGTFVPNADKMMGGQMNFEPGAIVVYASDGRDAGDQIYGRIKERYRSRGNSL